MGVSLLHCGDVREQLDGKSARNWNWSQSPSPRSDPAMTELGRISNQLFFGTGFGLSFLPYLLQRAVPVIQPIELSDPKCEAEESHLGSVSTHSSCSARAQLGCYICALGLSGRALVPSSSAIVGVHQQHAALSDFLGHCLHQ